MDPVVCPPHGEQKQVCTYFDEQQQKDVVKESTLSCNPGLCSGCTIPKWFGSTWDSKCIPYGFRFEHTIGFGDNIMTDTDRDKLTISDAESDGEVQLTISENGYANLFVAEWGNINYNFSAGDTVQLDVSQWSYGGYLSAEMYVNEVYYNSTDYSSSYIDVTFTAMRLGQTVNKLNAYCDIDGQVKQQKTESWGSCQNNYECDSNLCSYGECVNIKAIASELQGFRGFAVKMLCRISNPFNQDGYNQCLFENQ